MCVCVCQGMDLLHVRIRGWFVSDTTDLGGVSGGAHAQHLEIRLLLSRFVSMSKQPPPSFSWEKAPGPKCFSSCGVSQRNSGISLHTRTNQRVHDLSPFTHQVNSSSCHQLLQKVWFPVAVRLTRIHLLMQCRRHVALFCARLR